MGTGMEICPIFWPGMAALRLVYALIAHLLHTSVIRKCYYEDCCLTLQTQKRTTCQEAQEARKKLATTLSTSS